MREGLTATNNEVQRCEIPKLRNTETSSFLFGED